MGKRIDAGRQAAGLPAAHRSPAAAGLPLRAAPPQARRTTSHGFLAETGPVQGLAFLADGRWVSGAADGALRLHQADDGRVAQVLAVYGQGQGVEDMDLGGGDVVAAVGGDGSVAVARLHEGRLQTLDSPWRPGGAGAARGVRVSPDGLRLAVGSATGAAVYPLGGGPHLWESLGEAATAVAWLQAGAALAVARESGVIDAFASASGRPLWR